MKRSVCFYGVVMVITAALTGCKPASTIHFVVPKGYTGLVDLVVDPNNGQVLNETNGCYVVSVPTNGILRIQNPNVFEPWHELLATYSTGDKMEIDDEALPAAIGFRSLPMVVETAKHITTKHIYYCVGTQQMADDFEMKVLNSRSLKEAPQVVGIVLEPTAAAFLHD